MLDTMILVFRDFMLDMNVFLPRLMKILVTIVGGWVFAGIMKWTVTRFMVLVKFDIAAEKAGITGLLQKGKIGFSPAQLIGALVYWSIIFWIIVSIVNALGLGVVAEGLDELWKFLPSVIGAILILVLGLFFAQVLSGIVRTAASGAGIKEASVFGTITRYTIAVFTITVSLKLLGISGVSTAFNIFFGAVCFGLALAFGLGCKDIAGDWVKNMLKNYRENA